MKLTLIYLLLWSLHTLDPHADFESSMMAETATEYLLQKKLFLKLSLNSQENTCDRVFLLQNW